jgi:hypothetical protein
LLVLAVLAMVVLGARSARAARAQPKARPPVTNMSPDDLRDLCRRVGFPEDSLDVAVAVARAESRGNPNATNIVTALQAETWNQEHPGEPRHGPERSFGLWQVNTLAHPEYEETRLLDPEYNARAAFVLSNGGTNWRAWSTYTHQTYLHYMPGGEGYV